MPANVPFQFDLDLKSATGEVATPVELADGDLLIEGWGANYDIDREDEAFEEGAFRTALSRFLAGNAPLCYHHKFDTVIGKVISAEPVAGKGIKLRAIVDRQVESSPYYHIYDGIKRGRINGLSCGGIFKRKMTPNGPRIHDVDLLEWSATPVSVGRGTNFSVIAGKAMEIPFEGKAPEEDDPRKGEGNDEQRTGVPATPAEPEPTPTEEEAVKEVVEEKPKGLMVTADGLITGTITSDHISDGAITAKKLAAGTITSTNIEAGAITVDHLSTDLRSHFQELAPEQPEINQLSEALDRLQTSLIKVADEIGIDVNEHSEDAPAA